MWSRTMRSGFSLIELMVVIVVMAILAAVVLPRFTGASDDARSAALQSAVQGVRSSIGAFRTRAVMAGADPFPTLAELTTQGTVLQSEFPVNPYNSLSTVQSVSEATADARGVSGAAGWNYFVDNSSNPPKAVFYANSGDATNAPDGSGGTKNANEV